MFHYLIHAMNLNICYNTANWYLPDKNIPFSFFPIGASEAIAKAYAEELARHGICVILISSNISNLADTAKAISDTYGVEAILIEADFSQGPSACKPIKDAISGKDIGFIVNSLDGSLDPSQSFMDLSESVVWDTINRNIVAATLVTCLALPNMVDKGKGAVVNISAGRCLCPTSRKAALSASTVRSLLLSHPLECCHDDVFL